MLHGNRVPVLSLALASGAVDAFTFLALGQVFTSNMTGNLVLLGVSAGHGRLADAVGSVVALIAFTCGLGAAFRFLGRLTGWSARIRVAVGVELALLAGLAVAWALTQGPGSAPAQGLGSALSESSQSVSQDPGSMVADEVRLVMIAAAAVAMGVQSAVTHRLHTFVGSTTFITGALTSSLFRHLTPGTGEPHLAGLIAVLLAVVCGAAAATICVWALPAAAPLIALAGVTTTLVSSAFVRPPRASPP
ncbi:YoaK family protein [Nonomuraea maheshkhaliensis]|uniref:YoaK family protein n=1 Tax=Nonomuraea maheshkhaliensis TaxID=419590 RepID=A0ABN2H9S7_9ACTN